MKPKPQAREVFISERFTARVAEVKAAADKKKKAESEPSFDIDSDPCVGATWTKPICKEFLEKAGFTVDKKAAIADLRSRCRQLQIEALLLQRNPPAWIKQVKQEREADKKKRKRSGPKPKDDN